jgi:hypothetical protein
MIFQFILKKEPRRDSPCRGFIVSGAGTAFLHRHIPEVRRFISRKQVKMKLASGSPSGLVGGSTGIFGNAVLAPPMAAPSATADRARRAKFPPCGSIAWPPREGSAVIVSRIRNTCLHRDRIRRSGFRGAIRTKRAFVELAPAAWRYSPQSFSTESNLSPATIRVDA